MSYIYNIYKCMYIHVYMFIFDMYNIYIYDLKYI